MDHVAILRKANGRTGDNILGDIIGKRKTIESRWYLNKIAPWDRIFTGDTVYFKESGGKVTAKASVSKVLQYDNLDLNKIDKIIQEYGSRIAPNSPPDKLSLWVKNLSNRRYCILVFLEGVKSIKPFNIDKTGYGSASAWIIM